MHNTQTHISCPYHIIFNEKKNAQCAGWSKIVFAVLRQGENHLFTCEGVVSLAWSITQAGDAVFFGSVVVALPADFMVKTVSYYI
jgi:hypothetical protein